MEGDQWKVDGSGRSGHRRCGMEVGCTSCSGRDCCFVVVPVVVFVEVLKEEGGRSQ